MIISRRKFLLGSTAIVAGQALFFIAPAKEALAQSTTAQLPASDFMKASHGLVNHDLNDAVGAKIEAFAKTEFADYDGSIAQILSAMSKINAARVEDFFDEIPEGKPRELAYWIISAWYSGMSGAAKDSTMFSFEHALTYKVTSDMVPIPSYGMTGPNVWDKLESAPLHPIPTF